MQQLEAHLERLIVRLIGGYIGLRAGLLGTLGFEVAAQRCFALRLIGAVNAARLLEKAQASERGVPDAGVVAIR